MTGSYATTTQRTDRSTLMRAISLHVLLLASLGVASCQKPEPPRVTPKAVRLEAIRPSAVDVGVEFDVYNPNSFALRVERVEGALVLGSGVELGTGRASPGAPIPAKSSAVVASTFNVPWTNVGALLPFATSNQPLPYKFVGTAAIGGERLNVNVPFELQGQLSASQLVEIGLRGLMTPPPAAR